MKEAANTPETSASFYQTTRRNNPEDSHIHTRGRENTKFHSEAHPVSETLRFIRQTEAKARNINDKNLR
jgi:hypothetical protein